MNLVRFYHPQSSVTRNLVDELMNSFITNNYDENHNEDCNPATNVFENEKEYRLEILLPGFNKEDVQLNVHENLLTVKVDLKEENEDNENGYVYRQLQFGKYNFEKKFRVPKTVEADKIVAHFNNGILELTLPKKEEAIEKSPVEIKIS
ncbi:MAG: Hsp20/alpha crystallin family protein [Prolixibacteraceae bacterium]|jgi:HSP20 family protein|nr:Hsp20/alpha crystallin family protein [Prolixibacteraceae bacterium]MDD4755191.1 Hsp20/alpha crystallin family protein [Prolixibacteraceae bacterium]NLO03142.1 Hsp20/alpha crystallin family protein [Bacteroidales bacterium]